jgi:hypothetical protein
MLGLMLVFVGVGPAVETPAIATPGAPSARGEIAGRLLRPVF